MAAVSLFIPANAHGAAQPGPVVGQALIVSVTGQASYTDASGQFVPLKPDMKLDPGATIKTGANSSVVVFLTNNKAQFTVDASTTVTVNKLTATRTGADEVSETDLEVKDGKITGSVKKLSKASTFNVKTPVGVAGIRGTVFVIHANGVIHVTQGTVVILYVNPSTGASEPVTVTAGQTFTPPPNPAAAGARPSLSVINNDVQNTIAVQVKQMAVVVSNNEVVNIIMTASTEPRTGTKTTTVTIQPTETSLSGGTGLGGTTGEKK